MWNNGKFKGLFVTDLDGTLLTNNKTFNDQDLLALQNLQKQGYATAIATGRSQYSFSKLIKSLNGGAGKNLLAINYVIFSTGAGIMEYPEETIFDHSSLTEEEVIAIAAYLEGEGLDYMIHETVPNTHHFQYSAKCPENPDFQNRLEIYREFASPISPAGLAAPGAATEVLCIVPGERGQSLTRIIREKFPSCSVILATSPLDGESAWIEIFARSVSKSSTVEKLCHRIGVEREATCAVGNDYNDEDLLLWSPKSYMVENGPPRLKQLFEVVPSNNDCGVSEAVDRWLRG